MRAIFVVFLATIGLALAIPSPIKSHNRLRRDAKYLHSPPPERDIPVLLNALRTASTTLEIDLCENDPYKGVMCNDGNSTKCISWRSVCDGHQECGLQERPGCIDETIKQYGVEYADPCNGDESHDFCSLSYFHVPRCGRDIELRKTEKIRISSPNFPGRYDNDVYCFWRITIDGASQIIVRIIEFATEENYDYVSVGEGHDYTTLDATKLYLAKASGERPENDQIRMNADRMFIVFSSDGWTSDQGFMFEVRAARDDELTEIQSPVRIEKACNTTEELTIPAGGVVTIQSPNFPDRYESHFECDWKISLAEGGNIGISVNYIDLEPEADTVVIGSGADPGVNEIVTLSGRNKPSKVIMVDNTRAWVRFMTDAAIQRYGFELTARDQPYNECGGKYTVKAGGSIAIATPFYPALGYRVRETCLWQIQGEGGIKLSVNFTDFAVDSTDSVSAGYGEEPAYDWSNYVIEEVTGTSMPDPSGFDSDSNSVWIYFSSDEDLINRGFRVEVGDSSAHATGVSVEKKEANEPDRDCGYEIRREDEYDRITIHSPGLAYYRPFVDCLWDIEIPFGGEVKITFDYFQTEENRDWLTIVNGSDPSDQSKVVLDRYSGLTRPADIIGNFQQVLIQFKSDLKNQLRGFSLNILPLPWQECGGEIYVPAEGSIAIASPGWPYYYPTHSSCRYTIHGPNNNRVVFTVMKFSTVYGLDKLTIGEGCRPTKDGIIVLDGHSGNSLPPKDQFIPLSDKAWMHFKTTADLPYTGFFINLADSTIPTDNPTSVCEPFEFTTPPPSTVAPTKGPEPEPKEKQPEGPIIVDTEPSQYDYSMELSEPVASGMLPEIEERQIENGGLFN